MTAKRISTQYHIHLQGKLDSDLASWFPELCLNADVDNNSILLGELPDQSALLGILFRIHNLNLHILSVETQATEMASEEP